MLYTSYLLQIIQLVTAFIRTDGPEEADEKEGICRGADFPSVKYSIYIRGVGILIPVYISKTGDVADREIQNLLL